MPKLKTVFVCQQCGYQSPKWGGRCPGCEAWNTLVEEHEESRLASTVSRLARSTPQSLDDILLEREPRLPTGIRELDGVLGGGIVPGSVMLLGGEPGIGKSTLLLWMCGHLGASGQQVLYISGEESLRQTKIRAARLGTPSQGLSLLHETDLASVLAAIQQTQPAVVIIDSIQVMHNDELASSPGSVSQVRDCAAQLLRVAKTQGIAMWFVGHVTKDGTLAGPKVLEHLVDTVLSFEGDRHTGFRVLRAMKNRFGATSEIGVFSMTGEGLEEVANPSELFIAERATQVPGSMVTATMEGSRPLLVEIQALTAPVHFGLPRRKTAGVDFNRVSMLVAVLERRVGLAALANHDLFVSASGGAKVVEPAADLAVAIAIASALKERLTQHSDCAIGEVGLGGEVRSIVAADRRIAEAKQLGFVRCVVSRRNAEQLRVSGIDIIGVRTVSEALEVVMERRS